MNQYVMLIISPFYVSIISPFGSNVIFFSFLYVLFLALSFLFSHCVHQQSLAIFGIQRLVATLLHEEKTLISLMLMVTGMITIGMYT
jgi:hypothetical protein